MYIVPGFSWELQTASWGMPRYKTVGSNAQKGGGFFIILTIIFAGLEPHMDTHSSIILSPCKGTSICIHMGKEKDSGSCKDKWWLEPSH